MTAKLSPEQVIERLREKVSGAGTRPDPHVARLSKIYGERISTHGEPETYELPSEGETLELGVTMPPVHRTRRASTKLRAAGGVPKPKKWAALEATVPAKVHEPSLGADLAPSAVTALAVVEKPKCKKSATRLGRCSWRKSRGGRVRKLKPGRAKAGRKRGKSKSFIRGAKRFCSIGGRGMAKHCRGQKLRRRVRKNPWDSTVTELKSDFMEGARFVVPLGAGMTVGLFVPSALRLSTETTAQKLVTLGVTAVSGIAISIASEAITKDRNHAISALMGTGLAILIRAGLMFGQSQLLHRTGILT